MIRAIGLLLLMSWFAAAGCGWGTAPQQLEATPSIVGYESPPLVPSAAMDVDAAPIAVELSDFGEATAPKNDLMATIGWFRGTGITGRPKLTVTKRLWWWIRRPSHAG